MTNNRVMIKAENGNVYYVEITNSEHPLWNQCVKIYSAKDEDEPFLISEFDPN